MVKTKNKIKDEQIFFFLTKKEVVLLTDKYNNLFLFLESISGYV